MADYLFPTIGGILIGMSAVLLMCLLGRISGISGIFFAAIQPSSSLSEYFSKGRQWRWLFVLGLPLGVVLAMTAFDHSIPAPPSDNLLLTVIAGLLVGFGTKLGSGCTSGHGVCGISRFSFRSLIATIVFICLGIVTVSVMSAVGAKA